jgi:hypothetical protein
MRRNQRQAPYDKKDENGDNSKERIYFTLDHPSNEGDDTDRDGDPDKAAGDNAKI